MSFERGFAAILLLVAACGVARAEAQDTDRRVILVMESSLGVGGAAKVRAALRQRLGVDVLSAAETVAGKRPGALLAVALDRGQTLTVVYMDERGHSDTLSAPVIAGTTDLSAVIATLAGALLQKHLSAPARAPDGEQGADRARAQARDSSLELMNASRALYAALGRLGAVPRRTGRLSAEDF